MTAVHCTDISEVGHCLSVSPYQTSLDPEVILCNSTKMLRERLSISGIENEQREPESDFVYDLYYQETVTPGWIQDILSVRPYTDEGELVCWMDGWLDERKDEGVDELESQWVNEDVVKT